jgi:hypothetical protein
MADFPPVKPRRQPIRLAMKEPAALEIVAFNFSIFATGECFGPLFQTRRCERK